MNTYLNLFCLNITEISKHNIFDSMQHCKLFVQYIYILINAQLINIRIFGIHTHMNISDFIHNPNLL